MLTSQANLPTLFSSINLGKYVNNVTVYAQEISREIYKRVVYPGPVDKFPGWLNQNIKFSNFRYLKNNFYPGIQDKGNRAQQEEVLLT